MVETGWVRVGAVGDPESIPGLSEQGNSNANQSYLNQTKPINRQTARNTITHITMLPVITE